MSKTTNKARRRKPMTTAKLIEWRMQMGYDHRDSAHELGCTITEWRAWERGETACPRYIGLAMAALALGMGAFGEGDPYAKPDSG